jgi:hypothetical protein
MAILLRLDVTEYDGSAVKGASGRSLIGGVDGIVARFVAEEVGIIAGA